MLGPWNLDWVDTSGPGPSMWLSGDSPQHFPPGSNCAKHGIFAGVVASPREKYVRKWIVGALLEDQAEKHCTRFAAECNWRLLDAL